MKKAYLVRTSAAYIGPGVRCLSAVGGAAARPLPADVAIPSLADIMARAPRQDNSEAPLQNTTWYDRVATAIRKGY